MRKLMVSIIVPTYRRETELKRALDSLKKLDYDSYEIIVVDDNGDAIWNRKVEEQVRTFQNDNQSIIVKYIVNSPNMGSARTRNIGIAAAEGEYICFLDDDDIYLPKRVKHQLEAMQQEDADFSITDLALYDSKENLIEVRKRDYVEDTSIESLMRYHLMYHMTGTDTLMFKKEYLDKIGGFDPIDSGDEFYLMVKAIEHGGKFLYVPVCDVKAYVHVGDDGISSGFGKIEGENQLFEYKKTKFSELDKKTIRYIKMRHHAVLAFAYLRMKKYVLFFVEGIKACLYDLKSSIELVIKRK